jgi:mannose/fructose-specific phosphotransferase system component IIA
VSGRCGIVVGHGRLAEGLLSALRRVAGEQENVWAVSNQDLGGDELYARIVALMDERCEGRETYLLSDMDGGSCGQTCRRLLAEGRVRGVLFGVNLPVLVEFVFLEEPEAEGFLRLAVEKGRKALGARP